MYTVADRTWSQITDGKGDDREPAWSPDSRRAVFVSKRGGQTDLWIVDIATRALKRLTDDAVEEEYPAWSPDGRLIVFTGGPWKNRNFFVVDPEGGPPRAVLSESGNVGACSFGGGSTRLVCHSYDSELGNLIEIDVPSGRFRRLTKVDRWYYKPTESPDGLWIAVTDIGDDGERIRFLPHGSFTTEVMPAPVLAGRWPIFLAGNDRLFYHRQIDNGIELRLFDRMSGTTETVAVGDWTPGRGSLSPDHRMIAYCAADRSGRSRIFAYDRDNGSRRPIEVGADACFPAWSPDGESLAVTVKQGDRWAVRIVDRGRKQPQDTDYAGQRDIIFSTARSHGSRMGGRSPLPPLPDPMSRTSLSSISEAGRSIISVRARPTMKDRVFLRTASRSCSCRRVAAAGPGACSRCGWRMARSPPC